MQHTHTSLKAPLSADAILNDYLAQQHNLTLKRSCHLQTGFKQTVPPPHSPFALTTTTNHHQATNSTTKSKKATYKQAHMLSPSSANQQRQQLATLCGNETSEDSFECRENHSANTTSGIALVQRKLLTFFFIYIVIIATLFFTYALHCYHQQTLTLKRQQAQFHQDQVTTTPPIHGGTDQVLGSHALVSDSGADLAPEMKQALDALQAKMDNKLHLLERYLEVLAVDLEDTRARLREREKCACSISCSFNGTRYADGQRWTSAENKCDICSCQAGKISCAPRECPKLPANCESPIQLPGQCCPTCMKKCKLNQSLVSHGHTFRPTPSKGDEPTKQCKCYNGLIKCEPIESKSTTTAKGNDRIHQRAQFQKQQPAALRANVVAAAAAGNKTLEYLNSILAPHQQVLAQNERHRTVVRSQ